MGEHPLQYVEIAVQWNECKIGWRLLGIVTDDEAVIGLPPRGQYAVHLFIGRTGHPACKSMKLGARGSFPEPGGNRRLDDAEDLVPRRRWDRCQCARSLLSDTDRQPAEPLAHPWQPSMALVAREQLVAAVAGQCDGHALSGKPVGDVMV